MSAPKTNLWLTVLVGMVLAGCADFKIVENNRPQAEIVVPESASDKLKKDVACFNASLEKSLKTNLPAVTNRTPGKNAILFEVIPMKLADDDTFTIAFPDAKTLKITCSERSSRWAINYILQEKAGMVTLYREPWVRDEIFYPSLTNLAVPRKTVTRSASFNLRREPMMSHLFEDWNGKAEMQAMHGMTRDVFPATKYARNQSWPVEIMPVIGGKKVVLPPPKENTPDDQLRRQYDTTWQPCWSNPKTVDIAADNILEILAANPGKKSFDMAVNDGGGYCECDACHKVVGEKTTSIGHRDYSELYYAWVNKVAAKVNAKYPDVYFTAFAYREVLTAPSFKLHPRVAIGLCFDAYATVDPEINNKRWDLINAWSEKTDILGIGDDYVYGSHWYMVPRIYYKLHAQYIKDFYQKGGRTAFYEGMHDAFEGPKCYLMMKLFWDVSADPEKIINEWITACVGAQAAPYLRQYYQFWEDYWTGMDIRKTKWFESKNSTYMCEGPTATYTFALKKGDMAHCRKLMEQVVANAGTPDQKRRAAHLMTLFELSANGTTALFSEIIPPEGRLDSPEQAVDMLKSVPLAIKASEAFYKAPRGLAVSFQGADHPQLLPYLANNLGMVLPFLDDPSVNAALTALADQPKLPPLLRGQFKLWLGRPATNLLANGSFESEAPLPGDSKYRKRVQQYKHAGDYALMTANGLLKWRIPVQAGKTYLAAVRVFIPQSSAEGLFGMRLAPGVADLNSTWQNSPLTRIPAGQWTLISSTIPIPSQSHCGVPNRLDLYIECQNFEKNEPVYLDDVMVIELDESKTVKNGP